MLRILVLSALFFSVTFISSAQELERRAFMGILLSAIDEDMRGHTNYKGKNGVFVQRVFDQSSASAADIQANDILVSLNKESIEGVGPFLSMLKQYKTGDKVALKIFRQGKMIAKDLELKPFPQETNPAFETIYSSVVNGDNHQRIFLTKPFGTGPFPTVMILQGVGCVSSEYPFESMRGMSYEIIDSLTRAGYATIRVERSGMGDNKGQPCLEIDFETDLGGFRATIEKLDEFGFIDQDALFLMGFSMGGVIAPLLATETDVKGIIAYGTASLNWKDYETENSRRQYPLNFDSYESFAENMRLLELLLNEFYHEKKTPEQIAAENPEHAYMGAIAEALERYTASETQVELYDYDELDPKSVVKPEEFALFSEEQRAIDIPENANQLEGWPFFNRELEFWFMFDRLRGNPRFDALLED